MSDGRPGDRDPSSPPDVEEYEDPYSIEYLRDCADDEAREERLAELKRRIELKAYKVDSNRIAEELLERGLLDRK